ncbi:protoporphyrinogen/coproporphyrinogen oxidase [Nocardia pseudovaccinii]|uniref:protoporphyrinogen/coproporphyrinogen oxidase n=1 Tax=Nocardia pseudovaccinii TaxID=189540 RepID=UPI000AB33983|nr:NAD(P)/FAD-dependent oxidoreductase [Nocardia pseudovaccinii]
MKDKGRNGLKAISEPEDRHNRTDVVVVGAGIAGLTAAFRLRQQGCNVTVLEAADQVGGKMASAERDGYVLNRGAAMVPKAFTALTRLCADSGLGNPFKDVPLSFGIPRDGTVLPLGGAGLAAALGGIRTNLLSWRSKLLLRRLLVDMLRWQRRLGHDDIEAAGRYDTELVTSYAERRLNREIYDYLIDPLLRGIYLSDPSTMSVVDFFLTLGKFAEGPPMEYPNGIDFLARHLASLVDVRTSATVSSVSRIDSGVRIVWHDAEGEHSLDSRGCVIAVNGADVVKLYPDLPDRPRELIQSIPYGSVLKGIFGLRRDPTDVPTVVVVPSCAGIGLGVTHVDSRAMPNSVPRGKAVVSGHWVDSFAKSTARLPESDVLDQMVRDMEAVIPGFSQELEFAEIVRWDTATNARYVGFYRTVAELRSLTDTDDVIQLAGDYLDISGTNTSAESGERAAAALSKRLRVGA